MVDNFFDKYPVSEETKKLAVLLSQKAPSVDQEILDKYPISDKAKEIAFLRAQEILTYGKTPVKNPVCVLVGGQSGAGKSGVISYTKGMFPDGNVIILEDDPLRQYYPNGEQLSVEYPKEYIQVTNQLTNPLTGKLLKYIAEQGYNLIFHQTFKNDRIANDGIPMLRENGYSIVVSALGVDQANSRLSMASRCLGEIEHTGYCRYVTVSDHDNIYKGMPGTLECIEKKGCYDVLQVFRRGPTPVQPIKVFTEINYDNPENLAVIASSTNISTDEDMAGFDNVKEALFAAREEDRDVFKSTYKEKMSEAFESPYLTPEIYEQLISLQVLVENNGQDYATNPE